MKAIKYIFFLLLIAIISFSIYVALLPNGYEFSRSKIIKAPISVIYNKMVNFEDSVSVFPWTEKNSEIAVKTKENLDLKKNSSILQNIKFVRPFETTSTIKWLFVETINGTEVNVTIQGELDFRTKLASFFKRSITSKLTTYFENGLVQLDDVIQKEINRYSITIDGVTEYSGGFYLYNTSAAKLDDFEEKKQHAFQLLGSYALANNITMAGKPFVIYHKWDMQNNTVMFTCAIPTNSKIITLDPDILTGKIETFKAVKALLKGHYKNNKEAWDKTMAFMSQNNLKATEFGPMLEIYLTDSASVPNPANWRTEIFIAIK
jgi:effector-binding domain-containing protein